MIVSTIRLSQSARDQLITLKRHTGIKHWNVLARWGLFVSLAEQSVPPRAQHPADSNVEMSWKTFCGSYEEVISAIIIRRCELDGLDSSPEAVAEQFRLHLHRGISYLAADKRIRSIEDLVSRATAHGNQPHGPAA